jgi:hypothetical protein
MPNIQAHRFNAPVSVKGIKNIELSAEERANANALNVIGEQDEIALANSGDFENEIEVASSAVDNQPILSKIQI